MPNRPSLILTGATRGIGLKTCEKLLEKNYQVYALGRDSSQLPQHPNCTPIPCDLNQVSSILSTCQQLKTIKELEGLVLFAGVGYFSSLESLSEKQIQNMIQVNFHSQVLLVKKFLPLLKTQNKGHIIFMGSEAALEGQARGSLYCATKFAIRGFAQALKKECNKTGVKVSLINPGMVRSSFYEHLNFQPGTDTMNHIPIEDLVDTLCFLLSRSKGCNIDEINLQPMKKVIIKKGEGISCE